MLAMQDYVKDTLDCIQCAVLLRAKVWHSVCIGCVRCA